MDFEDQDAPPDLVAAGGDLSDEEASVKVPITIVTGKAFAYTLQTESSPFADLETFSRARLSRSWEDYALELHPDCTAWQKDCRDYEWWVPRSAIRRVSESS